jgi:hypothetical protein
MFIVFIAREHQNTIILFSNANCDNFDVKKIPGNETKRGSAGASEHANSGNGSIGYAYCLLKHVNDDYMIILRCQ